MLLTELHVFARRAQPLTTRERPECECISRRWRSPAVVDRLVGIIQGRPAPQVPGRHQKLAASEPRIEEGIPERPGRDAAVNEAGHTGLGVIPQGAPTGGE